MIPQLLFVLLSTGMAPVESFPNWVQPFVQYQPISQITETLRGLASGVIVPANLAITLVWCIGLLVGLGYLALKSQKRTQ
jgi:ABC-2 type transport system permease protein